VPKGWGWDQVERRKRIFQYPAPPSIEQHIDEDVRLRRSRDASPPPARDHQQVPKSYRSGRHRSERHAASEDHEEEPQQYFDQNNNDDGNHDNDKRNKPASAMSKGRPHSSLSSVGGSKPGHQRPLDNFGGKSDARVEYVGENGGKKLRIPSVKHAQDEMQSSGQKGNKIVRNSEVMVDLFMCVFTFVCVCVCVYVCFFLCACVGAYSHVCMQNKTVYS
jgi:hypothetical protein